jgi:hypothetical protein
MMHDNIQPILEAIPVARHYGVHPYFTRRPASVLDARRAARLNSLHDDVTISHLPPILPKNLHAHRGQHRAATVVHRARTVRRGTGGQTSWPQ